VPFCLSASCLGSLRVVFGLRAAKTPLRSRRPVSARSLRCASAFVAKNLLTSAFPTLGSLAAPAKRGVGLTAARPGLPWPRSPVGILLTGLRHCGDIQCRRFAQGSLQAGGVRAKIVTNIPVVDVAPRVQQPKRRHGRHPAKRVAGIPARQTKKGHLAVASLQASFHSRCKMLDLLVIES